MKDWTVEVRFRYCVLAILFATCSTTYAQSGPTGTWGVDGVGPSLPWTVILRAEGSILAGTVSSCASVRGSFEIEEGKLEGNTLTFKCRSGDKRRLISFVGIIGGDKIAFTWELNVLSGDPYFRSPDGLPDGLFGSSAPRQFTAKRIPDSPTGTWRVTGVGGTLLWEVTLRADGPRLSGAVSSCSSNRGVIEIDEGKADGAAITFRCKALNRAQTLILTGRMSGFEIAFTWEKQVQDGSAKRFADDALFGPLAPPQFIAKRVWEGLLLNTAPKHDFVRGSEFAAAVNLVSENVKAEGTIFIPEGVSRVRAMLMAVGWGAGFEVFNTSRWPELARAIDGSLLLVTFSGIDGNEAGNRGLRTTSEDGRADALVAVLSRLARESGHQELNEAPLLFWGHSFAAGVASMFADQFAGRTVGFVRFHGGGFPAGNLSVVNKIPALFFEGGGSGSLWESGRRGGSPWTLVDEPGVAHGELSEKAADLMVAWIKAVIRQRLSPDGTTLRTVADDSGWLGNNQTGEVAPYAAFSGSKADASWLPDEASARGWQTLLGKAK